LDPYDDLERTTAKYRSSALMQKSTQRAQTSANVKIWNKSDSGLESGFSD